MCIKERPHGKNLPQYQESKHCNLSQENRRGINRHDASYFTDGVDVSDRELEKKRKQDQYVPRCPTWKINAWNARQEIYPWKTDEALKSITRVWVGLVVLLRNKKGGTAAPKTATGEITDSRPQKAMAGEKNISHRASDGIHNEQKLKRNGPCNL